MARRNVYERPDDDLPALAAAHKAANDAMAATYARTGVRPLSKAGRRRLAACREACANTGWAYVQAVLAKKRSRPGRFFSR